MVQPYAASYKRVTPKRAALSASSSAQAPKGHGLTNTTPFPNLLLDEIMPLLKDTEWRLLCVIVRQTHGWFDAASGSRKASDWMTRQQLLRKTGRNSEALSKALDSLIRQNMVQAKDKAEHELDTARQRRQARGPIYYALHPSLLSKLLLPAEDARTQSSLDAKTDQQDPAAGSVFEGQTVKSEHGEARKANGTKENTKQTLQKPSVPAGPVSEQPAPLEPGQVSGETQTLCDENLHVAMGGEMSERAQELLVAHEQGFKGLYPKSEPLPLQVGIAEKLEQCCQRYGSQTLILLLPAFFGSDRPVFVRHRHSLEAFLSSVNLLLYGSKELMRVTGNLTESRFPNKGMPPQVPAAHASLSDAFFDWNDLSQLGLLRPDVRRFMALYLKRYQERLPGKTPPFPYLSAIRRLESLLHRHTEGELPRLLDAYFACDWAHVKAQGYSLEAFAHNAELLG